MEKYKILKTGSVVNMTLKFKDTEGENVGRTESFFFDQAEFAHWQNTHTDEEWDAFMDKYEVSLHFGGVIHNVDYVMGIYNK